MLQFDDSRDLIKKPKLLALYQLSPEFATVTGYHACDDQVSRADFAGLEEEFRFTEQWLRELQALPQDQLSDDQRLDLHLFEHYFGLNKFFFEEVMMWEQSTTAVTEVGEICFLMLLYPTDDEEKRFSDIAARLEKLPQYVKQHQSRIAKPPQRWRDISLQTTQGMIVFFDALVAAAKQQVSDKLAGRVEQAVAIAKQEAVQYVEWMKALPVDADDSSWALGPERFAELIRLRKLDRTPEEIVALGEQYLARYEMEARGLAKQIVGSEDINAARDKIESDAPKDFESALRATRDACAEAKAFLETNHLMDLPPDEELRVHETPEFLRPIIPFAAIFPPARFAPHQVGDYIVTPPTDPKMMTKHLNFTSIYNTAVHEGYPGHHLQLATANQSCSFLRSTPMVGGKAMEMVEGWAHYCEELMKNHGFHDTVEGRFVMVGDLIWRATRIIIDVKLSSGQMTYDEGVAMLQDKARLSADGARGEINRYTQSPGYQLSYLLGKHMILDLKQAVQAREKGKFSEASFHNRLLRAGSIPISITRREIFNI